MTNRGNIPLIKSATWGIGIVNHEGDIQAPLFTGGTGFMIAEDGFLITASHVISDLNNEVKELVKKYPNAKVMAFQYLADSSGNVEVTMSSFLKVFNIKATPNSKYFGNFDLDVSVCRIYGEYDDLDILKIKPPTKLNVYDEVFMCGYPKNTLTIKSDEPSSMTRTSPVLQTGRISTIFPNDETPEPEGIQTDIIGTGGSSGSPIINADDGEVIAIAQNVLGVSVNQFYRENSESRVIKKFIGIGDTGLIYGITTYFIYKNIFEVIEVIKKEFYENGKLKPQYIKPPEKYKFHD